MESQNTLVSIIMPVFNVEKYVIEAIESVCAQTFPLWELIIINDGSTDKSGSICDGYAQRDRRIHVFHTANGGVSRARNLGLEHAQGRWITFLDSDDYIRYDFLETLLKYSENMDLVVCSTQDIPTGTIKSLSESVTYYSSLHDTLKDIDRLRLSYFYANLWNKLYIREKVTMRFDTKLSIGEDMCFNLKYMQACHAICVLPDALNYYRVSSSNSLTKRFRSDLIEESKPGFYARLSIMGSDLTARSVLCSSFIGRVVQQSIYLAKSNEYSIREKKAILDRWASNDLWKDDAVDLSTVRNRRHQIYIFLLKNKKTWTALWVSKLFSIFLDWKNACKQQ